jgi:plasmid maintenance system killer protein
MGLDYSVELFFPIENIKAALEATLEHAIEFAAETSISLPNGSIITVPFANKFEQLQSGSKEQFELKANKSMRLILSMRFPFDTYLEKYSANRHPDYLANYQGEVYCRVGYVYLGIQCSQSYAEFSFTAATTQMSLLFQDSPSVHQVFRSILAKAGGLYGHIDIETYYEYIPLEYPKLRITPKNDSFSVDESHPVDWMLLASLKTMDNLRKEWEKQGKENS